MIPKKIHYCWFGNNPKSDLVIKCIESWRKYANDYEIIEWNETNYDINKFKYTKQAYGCQKYAFVSDVARFEILFDNGGIYLDTDVELVSKLDFLLENNVFFGYDQKGKIASGLIMGATKGHPLMATILNYYQETSFLLNNGMPNLTNVVTIVSDILINKGIELNGKYYCMDGITLYPWNYFDPYDYEKKELKMSDSTVSIHHYNASWKSNGDIIIYKIGIVIKKIFGEKLYSKIAKIKHKLIG